MRRFSDQDACAATKQGGFPHLRSICRMKHPQWRRGILTPLCANERGDVSSGSESNRWGPVRCSPNCVDWDRQRARRDVPQPDSCTRSNDMVTLMPAPLARQADWRLKYVRRSHQTMLWTDSDIARKARYISERRPRADLCCLLVPWPALPRPDKILSTKPNVPTVYSENVQQSQQKVKDRMVSYPT